MEELKDIFDLDANFDINAETLIANLLEHGQQVWPGGLEVSDILANPIGNRKRRTSRDVEKLQKKYFDFDNALELKVHRKSMFDHLPNRLFLDFDEESNDPKKRTRSIKKQIKEARNFFLPFDQAVFKTRIHSEINEGKYSDELPEFIVRLWGLDKFQSLLKEDDIYLLCHLLPIAHSSSGNWKLTEMIFQTILKHPVELNFIAPLQLECNHYFNSNDEIKLGFDAFLGKEFKDEFPTLEIKLKGISSIELEEFIEGGTKRKILEELLIAYFIPLDVPWTINIDMTEDSLDFFMGEAAVLGYNLELNEK